MDHTIPSTESDPPIIISSTSGNLDFGFDFAMSSPPPHVSQPAAFSTLSSPTMPPLDNVAPANQNSEPPAANMDVSTTAVNEGMIITPSSSVVVDDDNGAETTNSAESSGFPSLTATEVSMEGGLFVNPAILMAGVPKPVKSASSTSASQAAGCDEALLHEAKELLKHFRASTGVVHITIPSGKSFLVHIDLLAEKSAYFRAALTGDFQEAATKQLTLEDVSDNTFAFFLKWLYGQNLRPSFSHKTCSHCSECSLTWAGLFDLWFFADYTFTPELQNHIIENLVQKIENFKDASDHAQSELDLNHVNQNLVQHHVNNMPSQDQFDQVRAAIHMIWDTKKRTPRGEIAKPLRRLLLDFIGNRRYMTKSQDSSLRKTGLPRGFWYEFGPRCIDRNFNIEEKTESLVSLGNPFDSDEEDFDYIYENMIAFEEKAEELLEVWKISSEKYLVKDGGKAKNTKKA
ncbi:hypothetical protein VPNG_07246 [Cytospora leucostoma]|uniref:BTB domain-containing protein n=1 Tax=Cytospora leucostoma TaxID=1230097 RepID=A0A423WKF4_9PEZI|nr:hypothetical protein VPNG_07246 [Cytospora leucostoma]